MLNYNKWPFQEFKNDLEVLGMCFRKQDYNSYNQMTKIVIVCNCILSLSRREWYFENNKHFKKIKRKFVITLNFVTCTSFKYFSMIISVS